jgi:site-specific recombinase XerD
VGRGRRPRGIDKYAEQLLAFVRFAGDATTVSDLTTELVTRYQEHLARRCSPGTVANALTVIRSFCRWAIERGLRGDDPTATVTWPRRRKPLPRALQRSELHRLLQAIAEPVDATEYQRWVWRRNRIIVLLMLFGGLRISEVAALRWAEVDLDAGHLMVINGKGGVDRQIPIHPVLVAELQMLDQRPSRAVAGSRNGAPLHAKSVAHVFERWLPARGIRISAHRLRHTFASELLRYGADLRAIQTLLGHASLATTQIYLQLSGAQLQAAVAKLPANLDDDV